MSLPNQNDIIEPLLALLFLRGGSTHQVRSLDTYPLLAEYFQLTQQQRELTRDDVYNDGRGEKAWANSVQWARRALKDAGQLRESERGTWALSSTGIQAAQAIASKYPLWLEQTAVVNEDPHPDEVDKTPVSFVEGSRKRVYVNAYERSREARAACIKHHGALCCVCEMSFGARYGEFGEGYIHVHHVVPISQMQEPYKVDPINDLRPVCPNCHAMLHRRKGSPFSIEELRAMLHTSPEGGTQ